MEKAKYIGKIRDKNRYAVHLFYEYRGREYMVTDEHNGYSVPMWEKHRDEQQRIDHLIELEEKQKAAPASNEDPDAWWDLFNQDQ